MSVLTVHLAVALRQELDDDDAALRFPTSRGDFPSDAPPGLADADLMGAMYTIMSPYVHNGPGGSFLRPPYT